MMRGTATVLCVAVIALSGVVQAQDPAAVERGETLYADQRCGVCHSIADEGNRRGPLDGVGDRLSAEDLELWLVKPKEMTEKTGAPRRPYMRAYASLPREDIDALVAYMLSLKS